MSEPEGTTIVVSDTSVLINFLHVGRLDLLHRLPGYSFHVSEHVVAEVTRQEHVVGLEVALERKWLRVATMTDAAEIGRYHELARFLGDGEAASLALAHCRGWMIACDEKRRFRRDAEACLGEARILNTVSLLVLAVVHRLIGVDEADAIKDLLAERRYRIRATSIKEFLPGRSPRDRGRDER